MSDITYCTIENIKEITAIVETVSPKYIEPHIENSEILEIVPILGCALDTQLKDEILNGTLSGNSEILVNKYIVPASAWYSYHNSLPFIAIKSFNKGLVRQASDNSVPATLEEIRFLQQSVMDIASSMVNRLIKYLINNPTLFPNYRVDQDSDCDSCSPHTTQRYAGGIYLG